MSLTITVVEHPVTVTENVATITVIEGAIASAIADNVFSVVDNGDTTKAVMLQVSGVSTGTVRTLTVPDASGTIALTADLAAYQPLAADLTALAALASTGGMLARTGAGTFAVRTLAGTAAEIVVTNGDGVSGAPTLSLPSAITLTSKTLTGGTFSGPTLTTAVIDAASIGATTPGTGSFTTLLTSGLATFDSLRISDSNDTHFVTIAAGNETGDRTVSFPVMGGARTFALLEQAQTFTAAQTFSAQIISSSTSFSALSMPTGGISVGKTIVTSGAVVGTQGIFATNTDAGTTSLTSIRAVNDAGVASVVAAYSSGNTGTIFGITRGNHTAILAEDADCLGMLIGGSSVAIPIIFGTGSNEWARFAASGGLFTIHSNSAGLTIARTTGTTLSVSSTDTSAAASLLGGMTIATGKNLRMGTAAIATTATDGFFYAPTCAGTPTGTPTVLAGTAPIVIDTTNHKLYFYSGGAWRDAGP